MLVKAVRCASEYLMSLQDRRVFPSDKELANLAALDDALADQGADPAEIIDLLHRWDLRRLSPVPAGGISGT